MINLTDEQCSKLDELYFLTAPENHGDTRAFADCVVEMLKADPTIAIVKAPKGMQVSDFAERNNRHIVYFEPIPKPCPAPVLDPIHQDPFTVEGVYQTHKPVIPEGHAAKFGYPSALEAEGFTHLISLDGLIQALPSYQVGPRICLKKWSGQ